MVLQCHSLLLRDPRCPVHSHNTEAPSLPFGVRKSEATHSSSFCGSSACMKQTHGYSLLRDEAAVNNIRTASSHTCALPYEGYSLSSPVRSQPGTIYTAKQNHCASLLIWASTAKTVISILCLRSKITELTVNRGTMSGYEDPQQHSGHLCRFGLSADPH